MNEYVKAAAVLVAAEDLVAELEEQMQVRGECVFCPNTPDYCEGDHDTITCLKNHRADCRYRLYKEAVTVMNGE